MDEEKLEQGDRVGLKVAGTYRDQVLGMGHSGTVLGPCDRGPSSGEWYWIFWDCQEEALTMRRSEIEFISRPERKE